MTLKTRLSAEALGTFFLVLAGLAAAQYGKVIAPQEPAIWLFSGSLAVGLVLYVFITLFGSVSGAHFNPGISLGFVVLGDLPMRELLPYIFAQSAGGALAAFVTHAMFEIPIWQAAPAMALSFAHALSEAIAMFGLVLVIFLAVKQKSKQIPALVGAYVAAGYWMTSSSVVANPAVTFARMLTETPPSLGGMKAIGFILIQFTVAAIVAFFMKAPR